MPPPPDDTRVRLFLTGNEPRQRQLFAALGRQADVLGEVDFDRIDPLTKGLAAALSYTRPRSEWWGNYQMHPLVQRRRRHVFGAGLRRAGVTPDAVVMWGSWFHPFRGARGPVPPFYTYIDQSRSREPLPGEPRPAALRRERSFQLQAETYRDAGGVLCMSAWARQQTLDAHALPPDKVEVAGWGPCGVDLSDEPEPADAREPLVLHVSNDFRRKGVDFLMEVARRVGEAMPAARFVVIGRDGSGLPVQAAPNLVFLGPIYDRELLASYFRRASLFLLPHRFDRSPHVLVEAMSAGLPIVTSRQGGPTELVERGAGFAHAVGDIDGYTASVLRLLQSPDERGRLGAHARQVMRDSYTWDVVARRILTRIRAGRAAHAGSHG